MTESASYCFGPFRLRVAERELWREEQLISIEPKVFDLLVYLVSHRERAIGRDELIAAVWGRIDLADNTLAQAMLRLRRVLGDQGAAPQYIRTLPRFGYRWIAVTRSDRDEAPHSVAIPAKAEPLEESAAATLRDGDSRSAKRPRRSWRLWIGLAAGLVVTIAGGWVFRSGFTTRNPADLLRQGQPRTALAVLDAHPEDSARDPERAVLRLEIGCRLEQPCREALDA
jgi:DNA-binding winged helix-turn-helix (wHTH) protein